jgi:hypothetical protein
MDTFSGAGLLAHAAAAWHGRRAGREGLSVEEAAATGYLVRLRRRVEADLLTIAVQLDRELAHVGRMVDPARRDALIARHEQWPKCAVPILSSCARRTAGAGVVSIATGITPALDGAARSSPSAGSVSARWAACRAMAHIRSPLARKAGLVTSRGGAQALLARTPPSRRTVRQTSSRQEIQLCTESIIDDAVLTFPGVWH